MNLNKDVPFNYFEKSYYINLDHRIDRNTEVAEEFVKYNIVSERFSAVQISREESEAMTKNGAAVWDSNVITYITPEELTDKTRRQRSCTFSHIKIIELAKKQNLKNVLIFEDDVKFYEDINVKEILYNALIELDSLEWDLFMLGCNPRGPIQKVTNHLAKLTAFYTTHALAVNHTMYEKIINFPWSTHIVIDQHLFAMARHGEIKAYTTHQPLAYQGKSFSDIENKYFWGDGTTKNLLRDGYTQFLK